MASVKSLRIPLTKSWNQHVRSAMLNIISLAQYAAVYSRSWAVDSMNGRVCWPSAKIAGPPPSWATNFGRTVR